MPTDLLKPIQNPVQNPFLPHVWALDCGYKISVAWLVSIYITMKNQNKQGMVLIHFVITILSEIIPKKEEKKINEKKILIAGCAIVLFGHQID